MKRMCSLILGMGVGLGCWANSPKDMTAKPSPQQVNAAQFIQKKLYQRIQFSKDYSNLIISPAKEGPFKVRLVDLNVDQMLVTADGKLKLNCKKERILCFQPIGFEGSRAAHRSQLILVIEDAGDTNRLKKAFQDLVKFLKDEEKLRFGY